MGRNLLHRHSTWAGVCAPYSLAQEMSLTPRGHPLTVFKGDSGHHTVGQGYYDSCRPHPGPSHERQVGLLLPAEACYFKLAPIPFLEPWVAVPRYHQGLQRVEARNCGLFCPKGCCSWGSPEPASILLGSSLHFT